MDYQLTQTGAQVQEILDDAPIIQQELEAVEALLPEDVSTGNKLVDYNQMNTLLQAKQDKLTEQTTGTKVGDLSVKYGVNIGYGITVGSDNQTKVAITPGSITKGQGANIFDALATIETVIPSAASAQNKLTDKNYVDSAIATSSANFVGTFESLAELQAVQNPTNNDYGFVIETDAQGNEYYDRYKFNGTQWLFEYKVESTPFTADQWAAIQSGITSALVTKLNALPTSQQINTALAGKQDTIADLAAIRSGAAAGATAVQPATMNTALAGKQDTIADLATIRSGAADGATAAANTGDKAYDAAAFSGLGRKNLPKNIVEVSGTNKNVLTQAMINTANTIYVIQYDYDLNGQAITLPAGCVLEFDGGSIKNGTINGEIVIKSAKTKIFDEVTFTGHLISNLQVEWFGAKADGVTDSAPAIRQLISSLPPSDFVIEFSNGEYIQGDGTNSTPTKFEFTSKINFHIIGNGATIKAHPQNACTIDNRGFYFEECENAVIEGLTYNGNITERKPAMGDAGAINRQSAFDLRGCKHITFRNCVATGAVMDGFFLGRSGASPNLIYSEYCRLENCIAELSYRQGISVVGAHYGVIQNCIIRNVGQSGYSTSPRAGIDLEDGYFDGQDGWLITGCEIYGNAGTAISIAAGTRNTKITSCNIKGEIFHNDNNSSDLIYGNIITNCTIADGKITSHCSGLSLLNNDISLLDGGVASITFNNLRNLPIKEVNAIRGNVIRFTWEPSEQTYTSGMVATQRGFTFKRELDIDGNTFENISGSNPLGNENLRKFCNNIIRSNYDITPYGGDAIAKVTGTSAMNAKIYNGNIVEGMYVMVQEAIFDTINSPNDLRRFFKFPFLQTKGANYVYDLCVGKTTLLPNPTYIRIRQNEDSWFMLKKTSGTNIQSYKIEKGTSANDLTFSTMYTDTDGLGHILIATTTGGYFFPVLEVFGIYGALRQEIGEKLSITRRTKTADDAALTYTAPTV